MIKPKNENCRFYWTDDHIVVSHPNDPNYKKYWNKKLPIIHDYPRKVKERTREQSRERASRILELMLNDSDFRQYMLNSGTIDDKQEFVYRQHEMDMYARGEGKFKTRGQTDIE